MFLKLLLFFITCAESHKLHLRNKVFDLNITGSGCTFKGTDLNSPGSFALYNNCSGYEFAWIQHVDHGYYLYNYKGKQHFHRDDELEPMNKTCKLMEAPKVNLTRGRRLLDKKYASVKIITDNLRLQVLGGDKKLLQSSTTNIISMAKQIFLGFKPSQYQINLELDSVTHRQGPPLPWETAPYSAETVFLLFAKWAQEQKYYEKFHSVILLTGTPLSGGVIGIASLASFCRGGVAIVESLSTDMGTAKTLAHELGHNLGIRHTNNYLSGTSLDTPAKIAACIPQTSSVMSPIIFGTGYTWDSCSLEWFNLYMKGYPYNCYLKPGTCTYAGGGYVDNCFDSSTPTCGNTVIDPGEECDCGDSALECTDPCCDFKTCRLKGSCSPEEHGCCDPLTCQPIQNKNHLCRAKEGICQIDAYCDGESPECPGDEVNDYKECELENIKGSCYEGKCVSHNISCNYVKTRMNMPDVVGPCIRAVKGDVACRDLYCEYGKYGFCTYFQTPQRLKVAEGTKCGPASYCHEGRCVSLETINPTTQPTQQPTFEPTRLPTPSDYTQKPTRHKKRCVWRNRKRFCRPRTKKPTKS
jgi:hypothetical protein